VGGPSEPALEGALFPTTPPPFVRERLHVCMDTGGGVHSGGP